MNYKEKYEMALEGIQEILSSGEDSIKMSTLQLRLQGIFPELAESEDDRIRKAIHIYLDWLDGRKDCQPKGDYTIKDMIAWLEKQGENEANKMPIWKHWKDGICGNGEGKPIYLIKDGDAYSISSVLGYECDYIELSELDKSISVKDIEKPVGKVEPKFRVGDWIVSNEKLYVYQIEEINVFVARVNENGVSFVVDVKCLNDAHLWTIEDAKDGDVLQLGEVTAIFREYIGNEHCECYCSVCNGKFEIPSQESDDNIYGCYNVTPATKEQRELLFQKMKEAGYEWSDKNRKLSHSKVTKISDQVQKPAWSEEDEVKINRIVACLENLNVADNDILLKDVDWLKSLKDRVQPQPNQEWSEEDEKIRQTIINEFKQCSEWYCSNGLTKEDCINWLNKQEYFEWGDEDNENMNSLCVLLDQMVSINAIGNEHSIEYKNWLKSLKQRIGG